MPTDDISPRGRFAALVRPFSAVALLLVLALVSPVPAPAESGREASRDTLYQVSTLDALAGGVMDGATTFGRLARHGDFGLGTLNGLDGEMIALDGVFYQAALDGTIRRVRPTEKTPFAAVVRFAADRVLSPPPGLDLKGFAAWLDARRPAPELFYAIRVDGVFPTLTTRSVPRQERPFPTLVEAVGNQKVVTTTNAAGTLVGFRCPDNVGGLNAPGYHFHFLSADGTFGGHVLGLTTGQARVRVDDLRRLVMVLPDPAELADGLVPTPGAGMAAE